MSDLINDIITIISSIIGTGSVASIITMYQKNNKNNKKFNDKLESDYEEIKILKQQIISNKNELYEMQKINNELRLSILRIENKLEIISNNLIMNNKNNNEININKTITKNDKKDDGENNNEKY